MAAIVNVNGRISDEREAVISVFDHGFLYGEGIYETLRTYNGRLFLYDRHVRRLRNSARMIELVIPFTDEVLARHISDTIAATKLDGKEAYVRVLVTRGVGELRGDLGPLDAEDDLQREEQEREGDRKSTRLNSSHLARSRMPSSA